MGIYYVAGMPVSDELYHHGILGQKWGVRRYQNPDGTLTTAGKARYGSTKEERKEAKTQLSIERGTKMKEQGRTRAGAIGRGVGRQAAIHLGKMALAHIAMGVTATALTTNPATLPLIYAGAVACDGLGLGLTVGNVVKTYKDYRDISRAEGAEFAKRARN